MAAPWGARERQSLEMYFKHLPKRYVPGTWTECVNRFVLGTDAKELFQPTHKVLIRGSSVLNPVRRLRYLA